MNLNSRNFDPKVLKELVWKKNHYMQRQGYYVLILDYIYERRPSKETALDLYELYNSISEETEIEVQTMIQNNILSFTLPSESLAFGDIIANILEACQLILVNSKNETPAEEAESLFKTKLTNIQSRLLVYLPYNDFLSDF